MFGWGLAEWIVWQRHQVATKGKTHPSVPSWVCWVWCQWGNHDSCLDSDVEGIQTSKMPFSQILRVFRPKGWFCFYEGKLSPLEGMVTLIIYLIINQYYLGYLFIFTGVNQGSVNRQRWSFIHCLKPCCKAFHRIFLLKEADPVWARSFGFGHWGSFPRGIWNSFLATKIQCENLFFTCVYAPALGNLSIPWQQPGLGHLNSSTMWD